jgi:hypothetical protein
MAQLQASAAGNPNAAPRVELSPATHASFKRSFEQATGNPLVDSDDEERDDERSKRPRATRSNSSAAGFQAPLASGSGTSPEASPASSSSNRSESSATTFFSSSSATTVGSEDADVHMQSPTTQPLSGIDFATTNEAPLRRSTDDGVHRRHTHRLPSLSHLSPPPTQARLENRSRGDYRLPPSISAARPADTSLSRPPASSFAASRHISWSLLPSRPGLGRNRTSVTPPELSPEISSERETGGWLPFSGLDEHETIRRIERLSPLGERRDTPMSTSTPTQTSPPSEPATVAQVSSPLWGELAYDPRPPAAGSSAEPTGGVFAGRRPGSMDFTGRLRGPTRAANERWLRGERGPTPTSVSRGEEPYVVLSGSLPSSSSSSRLSRSLSTATSQADRDSETTSNRSPRLRIPARTRAAIRSLPAVTSEPPLATPSAAESQQGHGFRTIETDERERDIRDRESGLDELLRWWDQDQSTSRPRSQPSQSRSTSNQEPGEPQSHRQIPSISLGSAGVRSRNAERSSTLSAGSSRRATLRDSSSLAARLRPSEEDSRPTRAAGGLSLPLPETPRGPFSFPDPQVLHPRSRPSIHQDPFGLGRDLFGDNDDDFDGNEDGGDRLWQFGRFLSSRDVTASRPAAGGGSESVPRRPVVTLMERAAMHRERAEELRRHISEARRTLDAQVGRLAFIHTHGSDLLTNNGLAYLQASSVDALSETAGADRYTPPLRRLHLGMESLDNPRPASSRDGERSDRTTTTFSSFRLVSARLSLTSA